MELDKWIEIDVGAVKHNLQQVQALLKDPTRLIAVVKANAYGHGAPEIAHILCNHGVDFLAVSFLSEALQLRQAGIKADILVFSPVVTIAEGKVAAEHQLTLTVTSCADLDLLVQAEEQSPNRLKLHLKIDTGLGRFGVDEEEAARVVEEISHQPGFYLEGIYTHPADPTSPAYTSRQFERFQQVISRLERAGFSIPLKHAANSAAFLRHPEMHLDAVRIGTLLSGQYPAGRFPVSLQLRDPYKFKSRVISVRNLPGGSYLGYYRTYRLHHEAQIAVIPVGFNDGLGVEVNNPPAGIKDFSKKLIKSVLLYMQWPGFTPRVRLKGQEYPIRGKVFMQMALVQIPPEIAVQIGDEVEVPVRKTLASASVPRIYLINSSPWSSEAGKTDREGGSNG